MCCRWKHSKRRTEEQSSKMFSGIVKTIVLAFIFLGYLLAGAWVFHMLEHKPELNVKQKTEDHRLNFLKNYTCLTEDALIHLIEVVTEAVKQGINPLVNTTSSHHSNWDIGSAFFFAGTVVTTIGYGTIAPRTVGGQMFCVVYALIGIPINVIVLSQVGKNLSHWCKRFGKCLVKRGMKKKVAKILTIIFFLVTGILVFLGIPPLIFTYTEEWTYGEGLYYAFISLSTIGFGDYVVGAGQENSRSFKGYRSLVYFWILFGLAWLSLLINLLTSLLEDTEKKMVDSLITDLKHLKEKRHEMHVHEMQKPKVKHEPSVI